MTVMDAPTIYDEALYGEPIDVPMFRAAINTEGEIWTLGEWEISIPKPDVHRAPDVQRMISDVRGWTGWSSRKLAGILGTSHTTVLNVESGRPLMEARTGDLRRRVGEVHGVVERVFALADRDPGQTARVLETAAGGRAAAVEALHERNPDRAYLSALDVLRPRPAGMLVGDRPRREGGTAALHD